MITDQDVITLTASVALVTLVAVLAYLYLVTHMGIIILVVSALLILTYAVVKCKWISDAAKSFMWKMGFFIVLSIVPISAEDVPAVDSVGGDNPIIPNPPTMIQAASIILGCSVCEEDLWQQETLDFLNISCNNSSEGFV